MAVDPAVRARPLVFVEDLERPVLDRDDLHHFERVLRTPIGAPITVGDGAGAWREARFAPSPELVGPSERAAPPIPRLTVAFTPVKGERPEWVVQKLTELGVDVIAPVFTERSVVHWDQAKERKLGERLARTAREACLQCRRLHLPEVSAPVPLDRFLRTHPEAVLADPAGRAPSSANHVIVIGPEGGLTGSELASAPAVALPGGVLRAETAAVVAATVLAGFRSGLLAPVETS